MQQRRPSLKRFAYLSIGAALTTIALKASAYFLTGSVGLLSDALESLVNLVAAVVALGALIIAQRPPDEDHEFGHDKVEYFSSGVEGALILFAAGSIGLTSVERLLKPQALEQIGLGLVISVIASLVNLVVARVLLRAARDYESITLEADARHLLTDVWTTAGVIVGVGLVALTGQSWIDPLIALVVAANIVLAGVKMLQRSANGLMDMAISSDERAIIARILDSFRAQGIEFHALRTRQAGARRFISLHVLVPAHWTVQRGHNLLERLESDIRREIPNAVIGTHLEPQGDPAAMDDVLLDRTAE
jgi:cation diffusion facilitator family transporter